MSGKQTNVPLKGQSTKGLSPLASPAQPRRYTAGTPSKLSPAIHRRVKTAEPGPTASPGGSRDPSPAGLPYAVSPLGSPATRRAFEGGRPNTPPLVTVVDDFGATDPVAMWFKQNDTNKSGELRVKELQQALVNNNWTQFNLEACRLMMELFDADNSGIEAYF